MLMLMQTKISRKVFFWLSVTILLGGTYANNVWAQDDTDASEAIAQNDTDEQNCIDTECEGEASESSALSSDAASQEDNYNIKVDGKSSGPFNVSELEKKAASGELEKDTLVAKVGSDSWVAAETIISFPETKWYLLQGGQSVGPYKQSDMEKWAADGTIAAKSMVVEVGKTEWVQASTVFNFSATVATSSAPPAPPAPADSTVKTLSPEEQALAQARDEKFLHDRARHVLAGNVMTGVGILGSTVGFVMQILALSAGNDDLYLASAIISAPFGILRLVGAIASGAAARRYTRRAKLPKFKMGLFWAGIGAAVVGAIITTAMDESGSADEGSYYATQIGTQVLMNVFWGAHAVRAKRVTKAHRDISAAPVALQPQYAFRPMLDPYSNSYGLSLCGQF